MGQHLERRTQVCGGGTIDGHHPTATVLRLAGEFVGEAVPTLGEEWLAFWRTLRRALSTCWRS
jgi:hypothetical protein